MNKKCIDIRKIRNSNHKQHVYTQLARCHVQEIDLRDCNINLNINMPIIARDSTFIYFKGKRIDNLFVKKDLYLINTFKIKGFYYSFVEKFNKNYELVKIIKSNSYSEALEKIKNFT